MDWANERYVRLFVRDTTTWKLLPWQSRLLLPAILRKLDRSGVIDLGDDGEEGLAALIDVPVEFVQSGLPALLKRQVFRMGGGKFVMPNFLAAQEAKQSDAQRKRESRENQRVAALKSQTVTDGHNLSESQPVTGCPPVSVLVTPDQTRTSPDPNPIQEALSPRDPCACATEQSTTTAPKLPGGYEWLCRFQIAHRAKFSRDYGHGEQDARATGKLSELLESMPAEERSADWERRRELFDEFLGRTDPRTSAAGWSFAFFVQAFRGLAIPLDKRPTADRGPSAPHNLRVGQARAEDSDHSKTGDLAI